MGISIILPPIWILGSNPPIIFPLPDATQGSSYNSGQIKADPVTIFLKMLDLILNYQIWDFH